MDADARQVRIARAFGMTLVIAIVIMLSILDPFASGSPPGTALAPAHHAAAKDDSDLQIYGHIADDMRGGEDYYHAAVRELLLRNRPVHPFPTVRLPTLVGLRAALGGTAFSILHLLVTCAAIAAWAIRLRDRGRLVLFGACVVAFWYDLRTDLAMGQEMWAGPLVLLSLATRTERRHAASIGLALLACAIRETALTLPATMLLAAALGRRWRETAAWAATVAAICGGYAWHAHLADAAAAGIPVAGHHMSWLGVNGIVHAMGATVFATGLGVDGVPVLLGMGLTVAGLIGWLRAAKDDPLARRVSIYLVGWLLVMTFLAKIDNFYWAAMYAMLAPLGLVMLTPRRSEAT